MKFYKKYEDVLNKANYTVEEDGSVRDRMGVIVASEDRFGNAYCKDPNLEHLMAEHAKAELEKERQKKEAPKKKAASKTKVKKVRARNADGTLKADDPNTPDVNEAWTYVEVTPGDEE